MFKTLANTGMRVSELKYLTLDAVNHGVITEIESKGKIKDIPLPKQLCVELKHYCKLNNIVDPQSPILVTRKGKPLNERYIWRQMQRIGGKGKIPLSHLHPHGLRHLFGKRYIEEHANLSELADILGHTSLDTTRIYKQTTIREKRDRMGGLGL